MRAPALDKSEDVVKGRAGPSFSCRAEAEGACDPLRFLQEPALSGAEGVGRGAADTILLVMTRSLPR